MNNFVDYGFVRVAAAVPIVKVADPSYNILEIAELIDEADKKGTSIVVFPELCITGYTCADLFHQKRLLDEAVNSLFVLIDLVKSKDIVYIVGLPLAVDNQLFNCAVVVQGENILGIVPKSYIPGYKEFYEERWFAPGTKAISSYINKSSFKEVPFGTDLVFQSNIDSSLCFGIEICEDLWVPIPPSSFLSLAGATLIFNLSASNETIAKNDYRLELVRNQSARCIAGYVYCSCGSGESTTDVVFSGHSIIAENGSVLTESERFQNDSFLITSDIDYERLALDRHKNTSFMEINPVIKKTRTITFKDNHKVKDTYYYKSSCTLNRIINPHPFVPADIHNRDMRCSDIFSIQVAGLAKRLDHTKSTAAVIGISGGLDSTLALLVTVKTFDRLKLPRKNVLGITMPGFGTTGRTYNNALQLMNSLGITIREIDIKPACLQHFNDIGHDPMIHDVTYENVQARERTQLLMDIANKEGGLVIGTGDLSELALGWATYNGDHMSMYAVNSSIPKTLVRYLITYVMDNVLEQGSADVLKDILDTPVSPELLPASESGEILQKTEDLVGPYELHDFFLYNMMRFGFSPSKVFYLAKHAFASKYPDTEILKWLKVFYRRFFTQQFKRSCLPDGPKVGSVSLSPRGDWRMPSDASYKIWLDEL